jgi:hypothetical protein
MWDGLRDYDPALCQQILNIAEAQAESMMYPNGMADDIRGGIDIGNGGELVVIETVC